MSCNRSSPQAYIFLLLLSFLALSLWPLVAQAHSPNGVVLQYDSDSRTLRVGISHTVSNPQKHYVKKVTITKNGGFVATHEYTSQPEPSSFTYTYPMEAKAGDTLKATADCSYFGSETGEITVGR
jgi:desulfoferrodoxin (superoxide reductase-like protein)